VISVPLLTKTSSSLIPGAGLGRWLAAPLALPDGTLQQRDRGTPRRPAVSPVIASLFLHYVSGIWMARKFPDVARDPDGRRP
jgi:retron-type reverse transcriptase